MIRGGIKNQHLSTMFEVDSTKKLFELRACLGTTAKRSQCSICKSTRTEGLTLMLINRNHQRNQMLMISLS